VTVTLPDTVAGFEDALGSANYSEWFDGEGKALPAFGEFIKGYVDKTREVDPGIGEQIRAEVERTNREWMLTNTNGRRLPMGPTGEFAPKQITSKLGYSPSAPGTKADKLFEDRTKPISAEFFASIFHRSANPKHSETQNALEAIRNAYGSTVPADGGFLIPETLRANLLAVALESAVVRPRATVVPMDSLKVPFPTIDSTTDNGSVYGGVTAYWTEESALLTASQATFGRVTLDAKKLTLYGEAPNELFLDSVISFGAFIDQILPQALAWFEDVGFTSGTGVGEPLGYLKAPAAVSVNAEPGQPTNTIVWENVVTMYSRMLPSSLGRAVWVANIDTFRELATMALSVGTGGAPVWINNGAAGAPVTILGRPVIFTEKVSTLGTAGDLNFVDLGYYLLGDRQAMQASTSPHFKFQNDQTAFRLIERVDGRPWIQSAITPASGSANTLTPFVKIATRP